VSSKVKKTVKKKMCVICNWNEIIGFGNNAQPVKDGTCCNWCNANFVIPKRIEQLKNER